MLGITVKTHLAIPFYKQIAAEIKRCVATSQVKPGECIPTIRELANYLQINPATVARAYQELEREGLVAASRRRGTIVLGYADSPQRLPLRQEQLTTMVNKLIMEALSLGYNRKELTGSFKISLSRWYKTKG
jgi:GntR family transcriptional regulator